MHVLWRKSSQLESFDCDRLESAFKSCGGPKEQEFVKEAISSDYQSKWDPRSFRLSIVSDLSSSDMT